MQQNKNLDSKRSQTGVEIYSIKNNLSEVQILPKYYHIENIIKDFNVNIQYSLLGRKEKVYFAPVPTLSFISTNFGLNNALFVVKAHILSIEAFTTVELAAETAINQLAKLILSKYGYLKITEFIYFIARFNSGEFGRFYGSFDPLLVMNSLYLFCKDRLLEIDLLERQKNTTFTEKIPNGFTSREFYLSYKKAKAENDAEFLEKYSQYL